MDISSISPESIQTLSVLSAQNKVMDQVGTTMLAKTMNVAEQGGQALIQMMRSSMELSVNPSVGGNIDVSL